MKLNKWYSLLVSLFYFIYFYNARIYEGAGFLEYLNLLGNFGVVLLIAIWLISKSAVENILDFVVLCGFVLYLFLLHSYVTYLGISHYFTQEYIGDHFIPIHRINLIPFKTIYSDLFTIAAPVTIIQTFGNLLLLSPLAFAMLSLGIIVNKYIVVLTIFLTTIFIETTQFVQNYISTGYLYGEDGVRAIDIDDVILNTVGGVIGVLLFIIYEKLILNNFVRKKGLTSN